MLKVSSRLFPIGYIISVDAPNFNPHNFYIDGNWERIKGRVIVGLDENQTEFNTVGKNGGEKTHTLTSDENGPHTHNMAGLPAEGTYPAWAAPYFRVLYRYSATNPYPANVLTSTSGLGQAHNNLQPYHTAYVWKLISYSN